MTKPAVRSKSPIATAVITAAGSGTRLGAQIPKALVSVKGQTLLALALQRVLDCPEITAVAITCPADSVAQFKDVVAEVLARRKTDQVIAETESTVVPTVLVVPGGSSRQASVRLGLEALHDLVSPDPAASQRLGSGAPQNSPPVTGVVLVHDAARALAPTALMNTLVRRISPDTPAVIPGLEVADTIKVVDPKTGIVSATPARSTLRAIQTPQAFQWNLLWRVHQEMRHLGDTEATALTDDAALVEAAGVPVQVIPGDPLAFKVTGPDDLARLEEALGSAT